MGRPRYFRDIGAYADLPGLSFQVTVRDRSVVVHVAAPLALPITVDGVTDTTVGAVGSAAVVVEDWRRRLPGESGSVVGDARPARFQSTAAGGAATTT